MIKSQVRRMLCAQALSAMTVSLCLVIDNIMVGRFLGVSALAASSLATPILLLLNAVSFLMSAGVQVVCGRSLGKGSQEEVNEAYSTALSASAVFSLTFLALVCSLSRPLASLMGADAALAKETAAYMTGFAIGAPATMTALILIPFLQIAGQSSLLILSVLCMTVTDITFDLLNVYVFHGGMFGMGLASSLSYYVAVAFCSRYFLSKKCTFRFSRKRVSLRKLKEILLGGGPSVIDQAASLAFVFAMNRILLGAGGDMMVAAYSVISTICNVSNCVSTGAAGVTLSLSGIFYNEEDKTSLRVMLRSVARTAAVMSAGVTAALLLFAPFIVRVFIPDAGEAQQSLVIAGLRLVSLGLIPCCLNNALKNSYQGTGRVRTMEAISLTENFALPAAAALALRFAVGAKGIWCYFFVAEALALVGILARAWVKRRAVTLRTEDILLLPDDFGVPPEDLLEMDIHSMEDVMDASRKAEAFCLSHGGDRRHSAHMALCVEEMGANIVTHGFTPGGKSRLSILLQYRDRRWMLRFRDNCEAFDPVSHISEENISDGIGIRLAMRMADEAHYTYLMSINNLLLTLRAES